MFCKYYAVILKLFKVKVDNYENFGKIWDFKYIYVFLEKRGDKHRLFREGTICERKLYYF